MTSVLARPASESSYHLAEGPVWDASRERLLWVDETVGAVVPAASGVLLVAGRRGLHLLNGLGETRHLVDVVPADKRSRLNDGACDPAGRFLVGSLAQDDRTGDECLYRWDGAAVSTLDDDLTLSNGLAWSPDGTVLYSIDTTPGIVWQRPYDVATGIVGARSELLRVVDGCPDGMCLDEDGNLWVAVWGAGQVRCYEPNGTLLATVSVAAPHTSSVAFVGPALDRLIVTTAREDLTDGQLSEFPDSGRLFLADVGVCGLPVTEWAAPSSTTLPTKA